MATFFQLHSDLANLNRQLSTITNYWQAGDGVLLMGQTVAFIDWVYDYYCHQSPIVKSDSDTDDSKVDTVTTIKFYALQADFEVLTAQTQASIQQTDFVQFISDKEWVALTNSYDRIVTIDS